MLNINALLIFMVSQRGDLVYLAASLPLVAMVLFAFATDIRHWKILSTLNLNAPIVQVRALVDAVRAPLMGGQMDLVKFLLNVAAAHCRAFESSVCGGLIARIAL